MADIVLKDKLDTPIVYTNIETIKVPKNNSTEEALYAEGGGTLFQEKTVDPATSKVYVYPDTGYDALSKVTVNAMPAGTINDPYVEVSTVSNNSVTITPKVVSTTGYSVGGTLVGQNTIVKASDLVSGNLSCASSKDDQQEIDVTNYRTISISAISPKVLHGDLTITLDTNTGIITAKHEQQEGYVETSTTNATVSLNTQVGKTITPNNTIQTAVSRNTYTLGDVKVAAVPVESGYCTPDNSLQVITPETAGNYLDKVTVLAVSSEVLTATENGTYTPESGTYYSGVVVNIPEYTTLE